MSIMDHDSYRSYLREFMAETTKRNPRFSLRAMAKTLGIAPSYLSTVLRGEKNISFELATAIAKRLKLSAKETEYFCLLAQKDSTQNPDAREILLERVRKANPRQPITDLSVEHFKIISGWTHFAILVATTLTDFKPTARNLASALGIPQAEAELALERLQRLEMIERGPDGCYRKVLANPRVVSQAANQALRRFHRGTLEKAIESLETQLPSEKVIGSETLAIAEDQLEEFRELCHDFLDRAVALAGQAKRQDHVYHLGVQFFNMTFDLKKARSRK